MPGELIRGGMAGNACGEDTCVMNPLGALSG